MANTTEIAALQPGGSPRSMTTQTETIRDDRIFPSTRWIGACIPPFLFAAFILLYFFPNDTDTLFAWTIKPMMTPLLMGGGYISGSYFFVRLVAGGKWHWYTHGFLAITAFTWFMAIATFTHLSRFHQGHVTFYAWLGLYVITPVLVPLLWLRNRGTDPGTPDPGDVIVPDTVRWISRVAGTSMLLIALFLLVLPDTAVSIWPWKLTQLTAQVVGGWFAIPAVVGILLSLDTRWSAWRVLLESQVIALVLMLVAVARAWGDFNQNNILTWFFVGGIALLLLSVLALYVAMELRRRKVTVLE
jgi:hypothetical protein